MEKRRLRNIEVSPKYPNVVPIPALDKIPVHGHRGFSEQQGNSMANWGKK